MPVTNRFAAIDIPIYKPLETYAKEQKSDLMSVLLDNEVALLPGNQLIDTQFEVEHLGAITFTNVFAEILTDYSPEARATTYRAFGAAYTIASLLLADVRPSFVPSKYLEWITDKPDESDELKALLVSKAQDYIRVRPNLDDVLGACMSEIDPSSKYLQPAETMAISTLMIIDMSKKWAVQAERASTYPQN